MSIVKAVMICFISVQVCCVARTPPGTRSDCPTWRRFAEGLWLGQLRKSVGMEFRTLIGRWVIFNLPIKEPAVVNHDAFFPPVLKLIFS